MEIGRIKKIKKLIYFRNSNVEQYMKENKGTLRIINSKETKKQDIKETETL
jgi:hypothetical protein